MNAVVQRLRQHWLWTGAALIVLCMVLSLAVLAQRTGWRGLWATPDQRGAWLLWHGRFDEAAAAFQDPVWRGVALMRGGQFKQAAQSFATASTPEALYDRGNALVMLGQYPDAVAQYDAALSLRPGWPDAVANRALAQARADRFAHLQGEQADEEKAAPDEVYRRNRKREHGTPPNAQAASAMSDGAIRALWLRRVQTRPADFLRARFAYQLQQAAGDTGQKP
jgi:Ca-activated chloride channel family protein